MRAIIQLFARIRRAGEGRRSAAFLALGVCLAAALPSARAGDWWPGLLGRCIDDVADFNAAKTVDPGELEEVYLGPHSATNSGNNAGLWRGNRVWIYKGFIRLDGPCWFAESFDDSVLLKIDGEVLIDNANWIDFSAAQFTGEPGWHEFELRLHNGGGLGGGNGTCREGFQCGFGMSATRPGKMEDCSYPVDPGDMSLFCWGERPGLRKEGLQIAVSPGSLETKIACDPAIGWTNLVWGDEVECTAPAGAFNAGIHYARCNFVMDEWWSTNNEGGWVFPHTNNIVFHYNETSGKCEGLYIHRHGNHPSVRVTWFYEPDGYRLDRKTYPSTAGEVSDDLPPNLSDGCYRSGTVVRLTAKPSSADFCLLGWRDGSGPLVEAPWYEVTMDRARTVTAVFEPAPLTWNGGEGGVWRGGGGGWLRSDGTPAVWQDGLVAIFTNGGAQRVSIADAGVKASSVRFEGRGAVTLTNGPLTMISQAKIVAMNAGDVFIDAPLAGTEGLTVVHGREAVFDGDPGEDGRVVFPRTRLEEIALIRAETGGAGINFGYPAPFVPCQDRTLGDGSRRVQFQVFDGDGEDGATKFVELLFSQEGDGVAARKIAAGRMPGSRVGTDMGREEGVTLAGAGYGYGLSSLSASVAPGRFVIGRPTAFTGPLTVEGGRVEFGPGGCLGAGGSFPGAITNNGIIVTQPAQQIFQGPVSGAGRILVRGDGKAAEPLRREEFLPQHDDGESWTVIGENRSLADLPGIMEIRAVTGGAHINSGKPLDWVPCFLTQTPDAITFDLQVDNDVFTKMLFVELKDQGGDIAARVVSAGYRADGLAGDYRHDEEGWTPYSVVTSNLDGGYGVQKLEILFASGTVFQGAAEWTGGLTVLTGGVVAVEGETGLPESGTIEVEGGGCIRCLARAGGLNPVSLRPGGVLSLSERDVYSPPDAVRTLFLEGGILRLPSGDASDCGNRVGLLDVLDGGTVEGHPCPAGRSADSTLRVRGSAPFRQAAGMLLAGDPSRTLTLNVDDVTGDRAGDLFLDGGIAGSGTALVKTGPGTAVFSGKNSYGGCETRIEGGTIRFETDQAMGPAAGNRIVLNGTVKNALCGLDAGSCTNAVCTLALKRKGGSLSVRDGGRISFADSRNVVWDPGAVLMIDGLIGPKTVRFGTDANGLTPGQIKQIKERGGPGVSFRLDDQGWLRREVWKGFMILIQ